MDPVFHPRCLPAAWPASLPQRSVVEEADRQALHEISDQRTVVDSDFNVKLQQNAYSDFIYLLSIF